MATMNPPHTFLLNILYFAETMNMHRVALLNVNQLTANSWLETRNRPIQFSLEHHTVMDQIAPNKTEPQSQHIFGLPRIFATMRHTAVSTIK